VSHCCNSPSWKIAAILEYTSVSGEIGVGITSIISIVPKVSWNMNTYKYLSMYIIISIPYYIYIIYISYIYIIHLYIYIYIIYTYIMYYFCILHENSIMGKHHHPAPGRPTALHSFPPWRPWRCVETRRCGVAPGAHQGGRCFHPNGKICIYIVNGNSRILNWRYCAI